MSNTRKRTSFLGLDIFKLIVALILLAILILLLLRGCAGGNLLGDQMTEEPTEEETREAAEPTEEAAPTSEPTATTAPAAEVVIPVITAPADGAELPAGDLVVQGTAAPGADIELVENGAVIATTQADDAGQWMVTLSPDPGQHTYMAQPAGDAASISAPVTVTIGEPEVAGGRECPPDGTHGYQPDEDHYVVGSCDTLSGIAAWLGVTVEALLAVNPQITDPDLIFPGQVINVP